MAIPYNPSSFNSNKTILQAIEELKKYLQENPCYKIYMYNDNYVDGTYVYDKSGVDDPDSIEAYDVIFFTNSYYSKVESVGDSTITVWPAINFTGAEGPQGPAGADGTDGQNGADGVSITNVAIDGSNHLICTLSDGNTIDAGALPQPDFDYITLTGNSGTLTNTQYTTLTSNTNNYIIGQTGYGTGIFKRSESDIVNHYLVYVCVETTNVSPLKTILHKIIVDTNGSQAWTKSSKQLNPVQDGDIDSETATNGQVLTADGTGGASWETVSSGAVEGTSVLSTGETSGKVLTADGSGGASWQTAGKKLYLHAIRLYYSTATNIYFTIITDEATSYTNSTSLSTLFTNKSIGYVLANGKAVVSGTTYLVYAVSFDSGLSRYKCMSTDMQTLTDQSGTPSVSDTVSEL